MTDGLKCCRCCNQWKRLAFFPRDRSRPDGRWHTCHLCNRQRWRTQGREQAALRKAEQRERRERDTRQGLAGLNLQRRTGATGIEALPPDLRWPAQQLYNEYLQRHSADLTQQRCALLLACACSNVKRLGDRSWARRLWRLKGYRRAERRQAVAAESAATTLMARAQAEAHRAAGQQARRNVQANVNLARWDWH